MVKGMSQMWVGGLGFVGLLLCCFRLIGVLIQPIESWLGKGFIPDWCFLQRGVSAGGELETCTAIAGLWLSPLLLEIPVFRKFKGQHSTSLRNFKGRGNLRKNVLP